MEAPLEDADEPHSGGRPLLLLDADGVLNPFPGCPTGFEEHDFFPDDDEPVRLARVHGEWIRELGAVFEIAWVSSGWGDDANRLLCPFFGLPECAVVPLPKVPFEPRAKVPAVASFVGERVAAWVDDALTDDAFEWARSRRSATLLLPVDSTLGLTRRHVDELLTWETSLRGGASPNRPRPHRQPML